MIRRLLSALLVALGDTKDQDVAAANERLDHVLTQLGDLSTAVAYVNDAGAELAAAREALGKHNDPGRTLPRLVALLVDQDIAKLREQLAEEAMEAKAWKKMAESFNADLNSIHDHAKAWGKPGGKIADAVAALAADYKKLGDDMGRLSAERTKLEMQLAAERDCGQEDVCSQAPGCQRHWQERNRELVVERDALAAQLEDREDDRLTLLAIRKKLTDYVVANRLGGQKLTVVVDHVLADMKDAGYRPYYADRQKMIAALHGAGIKGGPGGGPGGWRWHSDPVGTTFGTLAAFSRLMLERLDIGDAPEEERAPATPATPARLDPDGAEKPLTRIVTHAESVEYVGPGTPLANPEHVAADGARTPLAAVATPKSAEEVIREAVAEARTTDDLATFEKGLLGIKVPPRDTMVHPEPGDMYVDRDNDPWLCCRDKSLLTFTPDDIVGTAEAYKLRPARPDEAARIRKDNGLDAPLPTAATPKHCGSDECKKTYGPGGEVCACHCRPCVDADDHRIYAHGPNRARGL